MTRTLRFYGASDDLFECDDSAHRNTEEIGCYDAPAVYYIAAGKEAMFVVGVWAPLSATGCWSVGVMPVDEDRPLPAWPMTLSAEGYSAVLTITVPVDAECAPHEGEPE